MLRFALSALLPLCLIGAPVPRDLPKVLAIQTGRQYRDYYGTTVTRQASLLKAGARTFRWGITNPKTEEMAYLGGTLTTDAKHATRFMGTLYADPGLKAPLEVSFKAGDRNGATLATFKVEPGASVEVDLPLSGTRTVFFITELKISHGKAERFILGEPRFE